MAEGLSSVQELRCVVSQQAGRSPQRAGAEHGGGLRPGSLTLLQRRSLIHRLSHEALRHKTHRRTWC